MIRASGVCKAFLGPLIERIVMIVLLTAGLAREIGHFWQISKKCIIVSIALKRGQQSQNFILIQFR